MSQRSWRLAHEALAACDHHPTHICQDCVARALDAEREAAAQVAQAHHGNGEGHQDHGFRECGIAAAIRALADEETP